MPMWFYLKESFRHEEGTDIDPQVRRLLHLQRLLCTCHVLHSSVVMGWLLVLHTLQMQVACYCMIALARSS